MVAYSICMTICSLMKTKLWELNMKELIERLENRTRLTLPKDWRKDRLCPECEVEADRPKCMWELGGSCPRNDPDQYEPSPYVAIPDRDCHEAANAIRELMGELDVERSAHQATRDSVDDAIESAMEKGVRLPVAGILNSVKSPRKREPQDGERWPPSMTSEMIEQAIDNHCGCRGRNDCDCISVFNQACSQAWWDHNATKSGDE